MVRALIAGVCFAALGLAACAPKDAPAAPATPPAETAAATPAPATPAATDCPAGAKPVAKDAWAKYVPWKSDNADVKKSGSGLEYVVLSSGPAAGKSPTKEQNAELFYEGRLNAGGCAFDSGYERGAPDTFPVGQVVPGFSEALTLMKPGDHWLIYIPSKLGYAERGTPGGPIPPNADLVFELELVSVK